jgi:pimeloyl-ACP methyl ester carboxylesterase
LDVPDPTTVLDLAGYPGGPDGDVEAFLKPQTVHEFFAQDLSETDRWLIAAGQRPLTLSANATPSLTAAWKTIPSWTAIGTEDRIIPPDAQYLMAKRAGATTTEVSASHVSMVSKPQAAIDAILAAVATVSD